MLRIIDSIKDRLASFYHWDDRQGLEQAISICREHPQIDFDELRKWSRTEGFTGKFDEFLTTVKEKLA